VVEHVGAIEVKRIGVVAAARWTIPLLVRIVRTGASMGLPTDRR
jgi:hypothetical protein